jgi:hypothetical protein
VAKDISDVQQRLHLHATLSIKTKLDKHAMRLEDVVRSLDKSTRNLLPSFLVRFGELSAKCDDILENQNRSEEVATARHLEIIASLDVIRTRSPVLGNGADELSEEKAGKAEQTIRFSLWFRVIGDRKDLIREAHKQTFDWVFRAPSKTGKPWDDLGRFLRDTPSGTYWISGKPGSGKSTLMKHISNHETTRQLLLQWAGQKELIIANFYFYHCGGSGLQKSEVGMWQSLLYQILEKHPALTQVAFPERYRALCIFPDPREPYEPTAVELRRAFNTLVQQCLDISFFLIVDGLDEYKATDKDMALLARTLRTLTQYPNVKALLSSRPWNVFEECFSSCPRLRLHELTRQDIARFVEFKIEKHPRVQKMAGKAFRAFPTSGRKLWMLQAAFSFGYTSPFARFYKASRTTTQLKISGPGFANFPQISSSCIVACGTAYPTAIAPRPRLLLLTEAGNWPPSRLSLLSLSIAETDGRGYAFTAPIAPLSEQDIENRLEMMRARLSSRCMGLVEVRVQETWDRRGLLSDHDEKPEYYWETAEREYDWAHSVVNRTELWDGYPNRTEGKYGYPYVVFLHRTLDEFMHSSDFRPHIIASAAGADGQFSARESLVHSALVRLKSFRNPQGAHPPLIRNTFSLHLEGIVHRVFRLAYYFEGSTKRPATEFVREIDRVMQHYQQTLLLPSLPQHLHCSNALSVFPPRSTLDKPREKELDDVLPLCVYHRLSLFVQEHITRAGVQCLTQENGNSLLKYICSSPTRFPYVFNMMSLLLESGATPNDRFGDTTLWRWFLENTAAFPVWNTDVLASSSKLSLLHGADLTSVMPDGNQTGLQAARQACAVYRHRLMHDPYRPTDVAKVMSLWDEVEQLLDKLEAQHKAQQENSCVLRHPGQGTGGLEKPSLELGKTRNIGNQQADEVQASSDQRGGLPEQVHECAASAQHQPQGPTTGTKDQDQLKKLEPTELGASKQQQPSGDTTEIPSPAVLGSPREEGVMEQQTSTSQCHEGTEPPQTKEAHEFGGTISNAIGQSSREKASDTIKGDDIFETHEQLAMARSR